MADFSRLLPRDCAMTYRRLLFATTLISSLACASVAPAQQVETPVDAAGAPINLQAAAPAGPPPAPGQQSVAAVAQQAPPFAIDPLEQQFVLQTPQEWERTSANVQTFSSEFERWEYNTVWGPGKDVPLIKSTGNLSFSKPDKGSFKIEKINRWTKNNPTDAAPNAPGDWIHQPDEVGEHWVCDGKAVYEYNHRDKQLEVLTIPPEMRGQGIVDGPLPFLFGAKANELMARYWIRTEQSGPAEIWLKAYPRRMSDAANYKSVDVMLDRKSMQPKAIRVELPSGEEQHLYMFTNPKVNEKNLGTWFTGLFSAPRTPLGWKRVMADEMPAGPQAANPQAPIQR
jgi:TIGR03009 family protein